MTDDSLLDHKMIMLMMMLLMIMTTTTTTMMVMMIKTNFDELNVLHVLIAGFGHGGILGMDVQLHMGLRGSTNQRTLFCLSGGQQNWCNWCCMFFD